MSLGRDHALPFQESKNTDPSTTPKLPFSIDPGDAGGFRMRENSLFSSNASSPGSGTSEAYCVGVDNVIARYTHAKASSSPLKLSTRQGEVTRDTSLSTNPPESPTGFRIRGNTPFSSDPSPESGDVEMYCVGVDDEITRYTPIKASSSHLQISTAKSEDKCATPLSTNPPYTSPTGGFILRENALFSSDPCISPLGTRSSETYCVGADNVIARYTPTKGSSSPLKQSRSSGGPMRGTSPSTNPPDSPGMRRQSVRRKSILLGNEENGFAVELTKALVLFDREPTDFPEDQLPLTKGDLVTILTKDDSGWWIARDGSGNEGFVPVTHIREESTRRPSVFQQNMRRSRLFSSLPIEIVDPTASMPNADVEGGATPTNFEKKFAPPSQPYAEIELTALQRLFVCCGLDLEDEDGSARFANPFAKRDVGGRLGYILRGIRRLHFSLWSRDMAIVTSCFMLLQGAGSLICSKIDHRDDDNDFQFLVGLICLFGSPITLCYEFFHSQASNPFRFVWYFVLGGVTFLNFQTVPAGLCCFITGIMCLLGVLAPERKYPTKYQDWKKARERKPEKSTHKDLRPESIRILNVWLLRLRITNTATTKACLTVYFVANVALFIEYFTDWLDTRDANNNLAKEFASGESTVEAYELSIWGPVAKGFGQMLNFNCSFIIFPVLPTFVRVLNLMFQRFGVVEYIPVYNNIEFHKIVAGVVIVASLGHILAHYINQSASYEFMKHADIDVPTAWTTGVIITVCTVVITSATFNDIKRVHFETFWFAHHLFIVYWVALLFHAPQFWKWFLLPGILYAIERLLRPGNMVENALKKLRGGNPLRKVFVHQVEHLEPNVLKIAMQNHRVGSDGRAIFNHREGMYLKLCCPYLSPVQYHAFTISSAPDDDLLTVHIKCHGPESWTGKLKEYFLLINPDQQIDCYLKRMDDKGREVLGRWQGLDGNPLLYVDGPYAAPCLHITHYQVVLLFGAGIGLTPFSSALKSIVEHRWVRHKSGCLQYECFCQPKKVHLFWSCRVGDVAAFRWFLDMVLQLKRKYLQMRAVAHGREFPLVLEVTLFVTGEALDDDIRKIRTLVGSTSEDGERSPAGPSVGYKPEDCIQIRVGRPDFDEIFANARTRYKNNEIGVFACGPMVDQLSRCCKLYTTIRTKKLHGHLPGFEKETTQFALHAEVF
eukprot:Rmarinus@m.14353